MDKLSPAPISSAFELEPDAALSELGLLTLQFDPPPDLTYRSVS